jgi:hypothetical protein
MAAYYGNITLTPPTTSTWSTIAPLGVTTGTSTTYTLGASTGTYFNETENTVSISRDGIVMKPEADLVIGGKSIKTMLERIESRLALLEPNTKLEEEWAELKRLGDAYRELEKEIQEKTKTWDILKK